MSSTITPNKQPTKLTKHGKSFEFDAPTFTNFCAPKYRRRKRLLEELVLPANQRTTTLPHTLDGFLVTELPIEDDDTEDSLENSEWFECPHPFHEATSPNSPPGPLVTPLSEARRLLASPSPLPPSPSSLNHTRFLGSNKTPTRVPLASPSAKPNANHSLEYKQSPLHTSPYMRSYRQRNHPTDSIGHLTNQMVKNENRGEKFVNSLNNGLEGPNRNSIKVGIRAKPGRVPRNLSASITDPLNDRNSHDEQTRFEQNLFEPIKQYRPSIASQSSNKPSLELSSNAFQYQNDQISNGFRSSLRSSEKSRPTSFDSYSISNSIPSSALNTPQPPQLQLPIEEDLRFSSELIPTHHDDFDKHMLGYKSSKEVVGTIPKRNGIGGGKASRVPIIADSLDPNTSTDPDIAKSTSASPSLKRVRVGTRFTPVPVNLTSTQSTDETAVELEDPTKRSKQRDLAGIPVSSTNRPPFVRIRKDKPVKMDELRQLLAEHNKRVRRKR